MAQPIDTRYSPPHLSGYVQTACTVGALVMLIATDLRGEAWPYLRRIGYWKRLGVTTTPFLLGRFLTGRYLRPVRELPDDVIRLNKDSGEGEWRPVADFFRWLLRPIGKHAIFQKTIPCLTAESAEMVGERDRLIECLGGKQVRIEAYQEAGRPHTLVLDGLRFEPTGKKPDVDEKKSDDRLSYLQWQKSKDEVVLIFPAYGGDMRDYLWLAAFMVASGRSVQVVDWRGYGHSEGDPTSQGVELDVQAVVDAAKGWKPGAKITCYGHCAGADPALYAAKYAGDEVKACVLDRSTLDWDTVVYQGMWHIGWPLAKLADWLYPYDCKARAEELGGEVPIHLFRAIGDHFLHTPENQDDDLHVKPLYIDQGGKAKPNVFVHDIGETGHFSSWWVKSEFTEAQKALLEALGDGA